jgi:hypothetical protein
VVVEQLVVEQLVVEQLVVEQLPVLADPDPLPLLVVLPDAPPDPLVLDEQPARLFAAARPPTERPTRMSARSLFMMNLP